MQRFLAMLALIVCQSRGLAQASADERAIRLRRAASNAAIAQGPQYLGDTDLAKPGGLLRVCFVTPTRTHKGISFDQV